MTAPRRVWPLFSSLLTPVLLWCAYPGGGEIWQLLFVALIPFLHALPLMSGRRALVCGFLVGVLHYLLVLYWITTVVGRYGGLPLPITILALVLLASFMASYTAIFAVLARAMLVRASLLASLLVIPAIWVGLDWLKSWLFSGFPWMDIGYALAGEPLLIQSADVFGHSGLSYLLVLINVLLVLVIYNLRYLRAVLPLVVLVGVLAGGAGFYSVERWDEVSARLTDPNTPKTVMGIVQGNIDQSEKWSKDNQQRTTDIYIENSLRLRTDEGAAKRPELVVWPETALPYYPQTYQDIGTLTGFVESRQMAVLTGAPWFELRDRATRDIRYFNSAQLVQPGIGFSDYYHKSHLVPFGEYVPMKRFLPFLEPLVESVGDFSAGQVEEPMVWNESRIGVLICFESIFADIGRAWVKSGANVLVNLTNDAWYGKSSAPHHSMAMTVFRAVETRRSVVRAANTGISGFIDPRGQVDEPSAIFTLWAHAEEVALLEGETVFVRWGYFFAPVCLILGVLIGGLYAGLPSGRIRQGRDYVIRG
ncbi:apolipoprotein N-acyltransferase [Desulfosediminicola ganghwensis]|uniref:apolipoprotein N-acyltransferase n=1 Tax=Desulfosediminicola ganghwensis TaxID=2569540 RepID=UPI0010AD82C8|nr:apolipoprotein N-acyltransferase [Desulfosediminicola ganghwensis]